MPLHRLVHLIESHSQELASELLNRVHQSPHLTSFSKVPDHELRQRVHEIYSHLGQWLMSRTEGEIARRSRHIDRKSTRLNSSHGYISYAVFCLKKKQNTYQYVSDISLPHIRWCRHTH